MSNTTEKLTLFKYDTTADAKQPFNLNTCMNDNWDKIDAFAKSVDTVFASDFSSQLDKKVFKDINDKLGQKLEAEVLLAENGYIKFNNGLLIQFGRSYPAGTVYFPITYQAISIVNVTATSNITTWPQAWASAIYLNRFVWDGTGTEWNNPNRNIRINWISIGF